jgi:hypothetical protein
MKEFSLRNLWDSAVDVVATAESQSDAEVTQRSTGS